MSVNISVSGKTLKECHDQIRALAREIEGGNGEDVLHEAPVLSQPAPVQNVVKFPITPEISTSVAQTASPGEDIGVDSRGLPWDARIHSSNKEKGKDGTWRRRRGVDPELEKQVEAELYAAKGVASPAKVKPFGSMTSEQYQQVVTPAPMPTTENRVALPAGPNVLSEAQLTPAPTPTFAPPVQAQVLPPNTFTPESFRNNLLNVLNDLAAAGKINHDWINAQKVMFGGKDVVQWHENQQACNELFNAFVGWGLINKL